MKDSLRVLQLVLYQAINSVLSRLKYLLELQTAVKCTLKGPNEDDVCISLDTTYKYLCKRCLADDAAAVQVVIADLAAWLTLWFEFGNTDDGDLPVTVRQYGQYNQILIPVSDGKLHVWF